MKKAFLLGFALISTASAQISMTAAGASFPFPLYSKMFAEYRKITGAAVNYQSVGSGAGQKQILEKTVDFAGSDNPMSNEQLAAASAKLLHIPTAIGAVVPAYNLPGVTATLKLDGSVLANIYLGKIKTWNDPAISKLNPNLKLLPIPITVVRRSDGSGTTAVFTDYLAKISTEFKNKVGSASAVNWPTGTGAKGNDGVAGVVKSTPGAIGYVELVYAKQTKLKFAQLKNRAGNFITADHDSVTLAASGAAIPNDTRASITHSAHPDAYPIASFTYIIFYQDQKYGTRSQAQAKELKKLLQWIITTGQKYNEPLNYSQLPVPVVHKAQAIINSMTYGGTKF